MNKIFLTFLLIFSVNLIIAKEKKDFIVAIVNDEIITNNEVKKHYKNHQLSNIENALEKLVIEKLQLQIANNAGIEVNDNQINNAIENIAHNQGLTLTDLLKKIKSQGGSEQGFKEIIKNQIILQQLIQNVVASKINIDNKDVNDYFNKLNNNQYNKQQISLEQILLEIPEKANKKLIKNLEEKANKILLDLRNNNFEKNKYSDIKIDIFELRNLNSYPDLFIENIKDLDVNQVKLIKSEVGFFILKILDKIENNNVTKTEYKTRHILLNYNPQNRSLNPEIFINQLMDWRNLILEKKVSFNEIASKYSQDGSSKNGGDLGWSVSENYVPEFAKVLEALEIEEISQPIQTRFGFHLILLEDKRQTEIDLKEIQDEIKERLFQEKFGEEFTNWIKTLQEDSYIEYKAEPKL